MFTAVFRFGGSATAKQRGVSEFPMTLLTWPASSGAEVAALLDCKASADGYSMSADHHRRFKEYIEDMRGEIDASGFELRYLVVLSSDFSGRPGDGHPFHGRATSLREESGVDLVYLRAVDLARTALAIEAMDLQPAAREALDWMTTFSAGLVGWEHLGDHDWHTGISGHLNLVTVPQKKASALEAQLPIARVRSEMFNAGAEWETALSMAAVASFAEAAMKAWDDLPDRLRAADRPEHQASGLRC